MSLTFMGTREMEHLDTKRATDASLRGLSQGSLRFI